MAKIKDELEEIKYQAHKQLCLEENDPNCNWCKDVVKDEDYYVNQCSEANKIKTETTRYGQNSFYKVEDKIVELQELAYSNGDDFDLELGEVIIHNDNPFSFENVIKMVGGINKAIYGIDPYAKNN